MCELGNKVINQIYEARREELGARKPQPGDPRYRVIREHACNFRPKNCFCNLFCFLVNCTYDSLTANFHFYFIHKWNVFLVRSQARGRGLHQSQVCGSSICTPAVRRGASQQSGLSEQTGEEAERQLWAHATKSASTHTKTSTWFECFRAVRSVISIYQMRNTALNRQLASLQASGFELLVDHCLQNIFCNIFLYFFFFF